MGDMMTAPDLYRQHTFLEWHTGHFSKRAAIVWSAAKIEYMIVSTKPVSPDAPHGRCKWNISSLSGRCYKSGKATTPQHAERTFDKFVDNKILSGEKELFTSGHRNQSYVNDIFASSVQTDRLTLVEQSPSPHPQPSPKESL